MRKDNSEQKRNQAKASEKLHQGEQLKYLIEHSNITSAVHLASLLNVTPTAVHNIYKLQVVPKARLKVICEWFNISEEEFKKDPLTGEKYIAKFPLNKAQEEMQRDFEKQMKAQLEEISDLKNQLLKAKDEIIKLQTQLLTRLDNKN